MCLCACFSVAQAKDPLTAAQAFDQRYWHTAIELLKQQSDSPEATRMLAIAYFQLRDFDEALPWLEKAFAETPECINPNEALAETSECTAPNEVLAETPNCIDLNSAMMEVRLALRQYSQADERATDLEWLCETDLARFGRARIELDQGNDARAGAKEELYDLIQEAELNLALWAADTLIEALLTDQELGPAYQVAQLALSRHPDPENAIRYAPFLSTNQASSGFSFDLGYRFEYDDNVTYPDDIFASGEEDYRHVLMADALYERPLRGNWSFYAEGSFLQSFYSDLDQFNQTRLIGSVAVGNTGQRTGWRLPLELVHVRLDGDAFRTSLATVPGFYFRFGADFLSHFYLRAQKDDYDQFSFPEEDRSGDVTGVGLLLTGQVTPSLRLRSYVEFNRYDTDGAWWERDQIVAFLHGEFELTSRWLAALAFRYLDEDFDNARPVFGDRQQNKSKEIHLNITHKFAEKWWWRGQVSVIDHDSNIPIFDYDRNIYSIAVTRDF